MMQGSALPALRARVLACRRGDRLLFTHLAVDLAGGSALHVTGANGTGKTTLLRTLAGLATPFAGEVIRGGTVGLLDERPALDPDQPLERALAFWDRVDGGGNPGSTRALLGLEPLMAVPVRYLSTGQRKRAGLSVLLNRQVPIWLLDEPLSGLDSTAIAQVSALIAQHVAGGGIAVIASHQPVGIDALQTLELADYAPRDAFA